MKRLLPQSRRGNALVVGLTFGTLLGFSALSVDVGMIRVADTQLQAAIDAAAMSGASELDGTTDGIDAAKERAVEIAAAHLVLDDPVAITAADVEVGIYADGAWTTWDGADPEDVNAVRIDHLPPQIGSALGGVAFGIAGYDISARAMAIRPVDGGPAASTECFLPLAIPDCWVTGTPAGTNPPPLKFTFSPTPTDAVAWGDPDGNPNSSEVRSQILGSCDHDAIEMGDPIYVNEGNHTTALMTIRNVLNNAAVIPPTKWDESLYGPIPPRNGGPDTANRPQDSSVTQANWTNVLEGPVALVDAGSNCSTVSFTGTENMTGVAWAVIYDVKVNGSGANLYIQLDIVNEHDIWGEADEDAVGTGVAPKGSPQLVSW